MSGAADRSRGCARLTFRAIRSENQYIAKLKPTAMRRNRTSPPVPPTKAPSETKSALNPAMSTQVRRRVVICGDPFRLTMELSAGGFSRPRRSEVDVERAGDPGCRIGGTVLTRVARWGIVPPGYAARYRGRTPNLFKRR